MIYAPIGLYALWVLYGFIMGLKRIRDTEKRVIQWWIFKFNVGALPITSYVMAMPAFFIGYLLDVLANVVILSVYLLEWPRLKEYTVTARMKRHYKLGSGRGYKLADWLETNLVLGKLDPSGKHIT